MNAAISLWLPNGVSLALLVCFAGCSDNSNPAISGLLGTNGTVLIQPNQSVGKIHAGMTVQQVLEDLGEPERRPANVLEYPHLGVAVVGGAGGDVQAVMCGDVIGLNGPYVRAFQGRTKEGIGMYSTRDEVIKAFGEPTASEKLPNGLEWLQYQSLGITFSLEAGKVHHMMVRLAPPSEPDRSVTIQVAPNQEKK
jgi:hypothetical protein